MSFDSPQGPSIALPELSWQGDWSLGTILFGHEIYHRIDDFLLAPPDRSSWSRSAFATALALRQRPRHNDEDFIDLLSLLRDHYGPSSQRSLEQLQDCWDSHWHLLDAEAMAARILLEAKRMEQIERDCLQAVLGHISHGHWSVTPAAFNSLESHAGGQPLGWDGSQEAIDQVVLRIWSWDQRPIIHGRLVDERGWHTIDEQDAWQQWLELEPPGLSPI